MIIDNYYPEFLKIVEAKISQKGITNYQKMKKKSLILSLEPLIIILET